MKWKDIKYLLAYIVPISGFVAVHYAGHLSYITVFLAFVAIPILEYFGPVYTDNLSESEAVEKQDMPFFSYLLYLNVPLVYGLVFYLLIQITPGELTLYECIGMIWSVGIVLGSSGINVAHELGHKSSKVDQFLAKMLLVPSLYMHFFIEHNRGHHKNVATPQDPATSRRGEIVYLFWFRSVVQGYLHAWALEKKRLGQNHLQFFSFKNQMLQFHFVQLSYLLLIYWIFGIKGFSIAIIIAIISFLLLETINYIEHYGLTRIQRENGQYEKVKVTHSWNSNHEVGRILLYELVRHSDHHYKASREYQLLNHYDESPQLPFGYPGSMILSFIPPLWFKVMHKELEKWKS